MGEVADGCACTQAAQRLQGGWGHSAVCSVRALFPLTFLLVLVPALRCFCWTKEALPTRLCRHSAPLQQARLPKTDSMRPACLLARCMQVGTEATFTYRINQYMRLQLQLQGLSHASLLLGYTSAAL